MPHVHLNPLFQRIPELDATRGGTILGASRDYVDGDDTETIARVAERLNRLKIDGLICVGGDGTLNGMQPLSNHLPAVLAPKTIDNDLGLNYPDEPNEWVREPSRAAHGATATRSGPERDFGLDEMVNYVTPGYATAVYVSSLSVQRIRTTAESHRRIAIIEVMGRDCGMIALGTAYGQPDIILVPESPVDPAPLVERVLSILDIQKHAVICVSEGIVDTSGNILGSMTASKDPAGNIQYTGAAEAVKRLLVRADRRRLLHPPAAQRERRRRDLRPQDRPHPARRAADPLRPLLRLAARRQGGRPAARRLPQLRGHAPVPRRRLRPRQHRRQQAPRPLGHHPRPAALAELLRRQAVPALGQGRRVPPLIFANALGADDVECHPPIFDTGNLIHPYDSVNIHVNKRIRRLDPNE